MKCKNCNREADLLYYSGASKVVDLCEDCYTDLCAVREQEYLALERYDYLAMEHYEFGQEE